MRKISFNFSNSQNHSLNQFIILFLSLFSIFHLYLCPHSFILIQLILCLSDLFFNTKSQLVSPSLHLNDLCSTERKQS